MKRFALLLLVAAGCAKEPVSKEETSNPEVGVDILFDYDGCRMYRFHDAGEYRYFARCGQQVTVAWSDSKTQSNGKTTTTYTKHFEIPTVVKP